MCGIVGYVGREPSVPVLLAGLARLEYRGYDSAGLAIAGGDRVRLHRRAGRLAELADSVPKRLRSARGAGIGHTRWATHGEPSEANAHPHVDCTGKIAVVHNGIIENCAELRAELEGAHDFASATDSEVLAHLIEVQKGDLVTRVRAALRRIEGTYGIAVVDSSEPDTIVVARNGSPVVLGIGAREMIVASDLAAFVRHTDQIVHLADGEIAKVCAGGYETHAIDAAPSDPAPSETGEPYELGNFAHFMWKEICEQPESVRRTLGGRIDRRFKTSHLGGLELEARDWLDIRRIKLIGCGSAYYAGAVGAQMLETLTRLPCDAEAAAEFRYRNPVVERDVLYVAISQSGETFDTLAAVHEIKRKGGRVLGIVNGVGSSIARACANGIYVHAGPEVSVASTKTFTSTLVALALLALHVGRIRDLSPDDGGGLIDALDALPAQIEEILGARDAIAEVARRICRARSMFFIGRGPAHAVAREGAQKIKEVAYIHAESYSAAELKHGPLALVGPEMPTVAIVPGDALAAKAAGSIEEIRARRGPVIGVTHADQARVRELCDASIVVPRSHPVLDPILLAIPLQVLAYEAAVALGRDVDHPRNLAKSVTVE